MGGYPVEADSAEEQLGQGNPFSQQQGAYGDFETGWPQGWSAPEPSWEELNGLNPYELAPHSLGVGGDTIPADVIHDPGFLQSHGLQAVTNGQTAKDDPVFQGTVDPGVMDTIAQAEIAQGVHDPIPSGTFPPSPSPVVVTPSSQPSQGAGASSKNTAVLLAGVAAVAAYFLFK